MSSFSAPASSDADSATPDPAEAAVALAERLLRESLEAMTADEEARMARVADLIGHPDAKRFSLAMTDRLGRSRDASRMARAWREWIDRLGKAEGFSWFDRLQLRLGAFGSRLLPGPVMAAVRHRLRSESRDVILDADDAALSRYLEKRREAGARVNLNQLGEAVLGEEEARNRSEALLRLLERDDVDYVSVKISALFSQIHLVAWEKSLSEIKDRLRPVFRAARDRGKFVNLDMEEYRDLELTARAFRELLDESEFHDFCAGMVLQAYLPDSLAVQRELTEWARNRHARGGAPVKLRLVKGANLAMERVEAEMHGWHPAPHRSKHETDAAFKRMLEFACRPENAEAVQVGVGSHNLFDVALALVLRARAGVTDFVEIEMLEGMAPPQSRAVQREAGALLYYAPIVKREDFGSALAYLIRRLDENTAPGNFLASLFSLRPGSEAWIEQRDRFLAAWRNRDTIREESRRATLPDRPDDGFSNEPDTDWTQAGNRRLLSLAKADPDHPPAAGSEEIERALAAATAAQAGWERRGESERASLLRAAAEQLARTRFETIALMRDEGKKAPMEADAEVSEAIDFARYYAETTPIPEALQAEALGTVVVTPPWNFPFAIPCGGVLAALAAGNAVILKPAPESVRIGWWLVRQLWKAGIPREVLHFVACEDGVTGRKLIEDSRTAAVILTGAYATARKFREWRPSLKLFAETSGKNALVVTALADRELAAKDLVQSAFGHTGQKCSAASLGILEAEVYDDPVFRRQLRDAAASLAVGGADDSRSRVTPLVQPPGEDLRRALTTLDDGEEWLLEPRVSENDPLLWSPGIKLGVRPGSWFHRTECFGPVLGLMRARDLDHAIELQNAVDFGLTAGLHSLDESEIARWKARVEAGNLYINRGITGAIVRRQPFGGWKRSSIGPGAKAGGPNYVNQFRRLRDREPRSIEAVRTSYERAWREHFSIAHDPSGLRCERNEFRYRPARGVLLRLNGNEEDELSTERARLAAEICGVPLTISRESEESAADLAARLPEIAGALEFLRTTGQAPSGELLRAAAEHDLNWIDAPVVAEGRVELTRWTREQSVTETRHRYGNVIAD